jgi:hypothetical protein
VRVTVVSTRDDEETSVLGRRGPENAEGGGYFRDAVVSELATMRQQVVDDGLPRLVKGHAKLREQLQQIVTSLGSDVFAADAPYGTRLLDNGQVRLAWNLVVTLVSPHRLVLVRADRHFDASPGDDPDAVSRALAALSSRELEITARWDVPLTNAGKICLEMHPGQDPWMSVEALGDHRVPLGSIAMAQRVADTIGGRSVDGGQPPPTGSD